MDWTDLETLYPNLLASEEQTKSRTTYRRDLLAKYTGPNYDSDGVQYDAENTAYELSTWLQGNMVYSNPRVRVRSRRDDDDRYAIAAEALQNGLNRVLADMKLRRKLLPIVTDMCLGYGVHLVTCESNKKLRYADIPNEVNARTDGYAKMPQVQRVAPERWGADHMAESLEEAQFVWHKRQLALDDLLESAKADPKTWNIDAIHGLAPISGEEEVGGRELPPKRQWVAIYEIFVPAMHMSEEPGFNGALLTLGAMQAPNSSPNAIKDRKAWVRPPMPYKGPPTGPHVLYGVSPVPGHVHPLGPIIASMSLIDELNRMDKALSKAAKNAKTGLMFDAADMEMAEAVKQLEDQGYIGVQGFNKDRIAEIELWGIRPESIAWRDDRRALLNRMLAFDEEQRGTSTKGVTATSTAIAAQNSNIRLGLITAQFQDSLVELCEKIAYMMWYEQEVVFPFANPITGRTDWFEGGMGTDSNSVNFWDLELDIEPYSHERTDEAVHQQRMMVATEALVAQIPNMAMLPIPELWKLALTPLGNAMNDPDLGDRAEQMVESILAGGGDQMMAQQGAGGAGGGPPSGNGAPQPQGGAGALRPTMSGTQTMPKPAENVLKRATARASQGTSMGAQAGARSER